MFTFEKRNYRERQTNLVSNSQLEVNSEETRKTALEIVLVSLILTLNKYLPAW